jgi:hypothetical protein
VDSGSIFKDNQVNDLGCFALGLMMSSLLSLLVQLMLLKSLIEKVGIIFGSSVIPSS